MKLPSLLSLVLLFHISTAPSWVEGANAASAATQQINRGFSANPNPASSSTFQSLLSDPTNVFSLGFQRVNSTQLELAVLHVPSSLPVWRATFARPALWASSTALSFNGSMVLSDPEGGVLWSTQTDGSDRVVLLNSSNLFRSWPNPSPFYGKASIFRRTPLSKPRTSRPPPLCSP